MTDEEIEAMFTPGPPCAQLLGWRLLDHDEARGWIKVGFVEGRLLDEDGRLLARATSSVMLVPAERVAV